MTSFASSRTPAARAMAPSPAALRLLALVAMLPAPLIAQTTFNWTGGVDNDWSTDGNWDQTGAPTSADAAIIENDGVVSVIDGAVADSLQIGGNNTSGTVSINAGGTLTLAGGLTVGCGCAPAAFTADTGGSGSSSFVSINAGSTFTVTGTGAVWTSAEGVNLSGAASAISVQAGGMLTISGRDPNIVGVDSAPGRFTIGDYDDDGIGSENSLTIDGGGVVTVQSVVIPPELDDPENPQGFAHGTSQLGYAAGSTGTATVTGAGSVWNTGHLTVGVFGTGDLTIADGGVVNTVNADLANGNAGGAGETVGTVLVTGGGSQWNVSDAFKIGGYADDDFYNSGTLTIEDGASVTVGGGTGVVEIHTNGLVNIGVGGLSGALNAAEVLLVDTASESSLNATSATLRFNHTDDITFAAAITGAGRVVKDGAGTTILTAASTYSGPTYVNAGALVIDVGGEWQASTAFEVDGSDTILRIATGSTVAADLLATGGASVEVAGTLAENPFESTFDDDSSLHVLSTGTIWDGYFTFNNLSSLVVDDGGVIAGGDFYFDHTATFVATGAGAVTDGLLGFGGNRAVTLPSAGVITGGYIELYDTVSTDLNQTGVIDGGLGGDVVLDLYDTSHATISATAAVDSSAVTLWDQSTVSITATGAVFNSLLDIGDDAVVTLGAADALEESGVYLGGNGAFVLNGNDVTVVDFIAYGGRVVNNSAAPATLALDLCGCYPVAAIGNIFADSDDSHVGPAGALSLVINGSDPTTTAAVFVGVQRHTGSTTVNGATLVVYGDAYDHDEDPETDPVLAGFLSSPIILNMGSILTGPGPVDSVAVNDGSGLAPGDGVGTLFTESVTLSGNTTFDIDLADFSGGAGLGWDLLEVTGTFSFSTVLGNTFTVFLSSVDPDDVDNLAANFDPMQDYSLPIIVASGGITDFSVGATAVDSSTFANAHGGGWTLRISPDTSTLYLDYTAPIPEPASAAVLIAGFATLTLGGRRRRA